MADQSCKKQDILNRSALDPLAPSSSDAAPQFCTDSILHPIDQGSTHDEYDHPPGYSEPVRNESYNPSQPPIISTPGMSELDYTQYLPPGSFLSKDKSTVTVVHPDLTTNPKALLKFITVQASLPPKPHIRITGSFSSSIDFDIQLNMMRYFMPPTSSRWNYVKLVEPSELAFRGSTVKTVTPHMDSGIDGWATRFCRDAAQGKSFTLLRETINWNTAYIEGRVRSLVASLRYHGKVTVTFPVTYTHVVVQDTEPSSGFVSTVLSFFKEGPRRYEVTRSIWPYANMAAGDEMTVTNRVCTVHSEAQWWEDWNQVIAAAILEKRQGWVTVEDLIVRTMNPPFEVKASRDWGLQRV